MTSTREKFNALVSLEKTTTVERNRESIKNRDRLRESQQIALKVLNKLDELGWSQKELAKKLDVSPQQVNKIVSGKENLTLETQVKLQEVLDIAILATYYEKKANELLESIKTYIKETYTVPEKSNVNKQKSEVFAQKHLKMEYNQVSSEYSYYSVA